MKSKYLRLRVPEGEGSEVIEYESKKPYFGWYSKDKLNIPGVGSVVSAASIGTNIYILGDSSTSKTVYKYDTITNTYSNAAEMLYAKYIPTVSVIDGMIYISGGNDGSSSHVPLEYAPVILKYDPETNIWYDVGRTLERRMLASSFVINGKIYICGGQTYPNNGNGNSSSPLTNLNSVEMFDPETGINTYVKNLPFNLYNATSYIKNNKVYLFGGVSQENAYIRSPTEKVIEYDPNLGELIPVSVSFSENIATLVKTIPSGSTTFNINGDWYMLGGVGGVGPEQRYFKKYNSVDKIWEDKTLMLFPAYSGETTYVIVGNVAYVATGYEYIQYYDSVTETWSKTIIPFIKPNSIGSPNRTPICHMDGYLYVVLSFSIYKYDIVNNEWSTVYTMVENRRNASHFTSGDDIYMSGGYKPPTDKMNVKYNTVTSTLTVLRGFYLEHIFRYDGNVYAFRSSQPYIYMYDINNDVWIRKGYLSYSPTNITIHPNDEGLHILYYDSKIRYAVRMDITSIPSGVWQETVPMRVPSDLPGIIEQENALLLVGGSNGYNLRTVESYNMDTPETTEPVTIKYETDQPYQDVLVPVNGKNYTVGGGGKTVRLLEYISEDLSFIKKKFYRHIHKKPELDVALIDSTYIPQPGEVGEGFVSDYYPMYYDGVNQLFFNDMMYGFCISDKVYAFGITPGSTLPRKVVMNLTDKTYDITDYTTENANTVPTVTATQCIEFVIDGKGYLCNGKMYFSPESTDGIGDPLFAATIQYDPVLDSWTRMTDMLLSTSLDAPAAAVANGLAYVIGSVPNSKKLTEIEIFDPVANNWERITDISMHTTASYGTAAFYDGLIYVLADYNKDYHPYVFRFDPVTRVTSMTSARKINAYYDDSTSFILNEKLIITTGNLGYKVEVYDSQTNVWSMSGDPGVPYLEGGRGYGDYIISGVYNNTAYIFHEEGCTILKPTDFIKKINMTEIIENDGTDTSDCILAVRISESVSS